MLRNLAGLVIVLAFLLGTPVHAEPLDPARTGTIELHFAHPNPYSDVPGPSAVGVGARVQRYIHADLTNHDGWQAAAALEAPELLKLDDAHFDTTRTGVSDSRGFLTFNNLPLGLYLITPVDPGALDPFVVTVPSTSTGGDSWRYAITAYPKVAGSSPDDGADGDSDSDGDSGTPRPPTPFPTPRPSPSQPVVASPPVAGSSPTPIIAPVDGGSVSRGGSDGLASTGANVWGFIAAGMMSLLAGGYLILRKRHESEDE